MSGAEDVAPCVTIWIRGTKTIIPILYLLRTTKTLLDMLMKYARAELKKFRDQNILSKDEIIGAENCYIEIESVEDNRAIINGNGDGGGVKTSNRKLSMARMDDLSRLSGLSERYT